MDENVVPDETLSEEEEAPRVDVNTLPEIPFKRRSRGHNTYAARQGIRCPELDARDIADLEIIFNEPQVTQLERAKRLGFADPKSLTIRENRPVFLEELHKRMDYALAVASSCIPEWLREAIVNGDDMKNLPARVQAGLGLL
jgi:hypothetical protein